MFDALEAPVPTTEGPRRRVSSPTNVISLDHKANGPIVDDRQELFFQSHTIQNDTFRMGTFSFQNIVQQFSTAI